MLRGEEADNEDEHAELVLSADYPNDRDEDLIEINLELKEK